MLAAGDILLIGPNENTFLSSKQSIASLASSCYFCDLYLGSDLMMTSVSTMGCKNEAALSYYMLTVLRLMSGFFS